MLRRSAWTLLVFLAFTSFLSGCSDVFHTLSNPPAERDLKITLGGFLKGGNEQQTIDGVCGTEPARNVVNCDIYNGLPNWKLTEVVICITWYPYSESEIRYFRQRVSIFPLTTASLSMRIGAQLPADTSIFGKTQQHWSWLVFSAKGIPEPSPRN